MEYKFDVKAKNTLRSISNCRINAHSRQLPSGTEACISVADLFCGAGGLSTGLIQAGLDVVVAVDNYAPAVATYRANHAHDVHSLDLADVEAATAALRPYRPEVLAGGPPCQDFSTSGRRQEGARADLTHAFVRIGIELGCRYVVMENVDRALKSSVYMAAMARLRSAGYGLSIFVLNCAYYGAPQVRKRAFVCGKLGAPENWLPTPQPLSSTPMSIREHLGDDIDIDHYYRHPRSYKRRSVFSVDQPSPTIRGTNRPVPRKHPAHPGDSADVRTVRALTTAERALIQTFPRDYRWCGSKTAIEQMVGNAVPCALGKVLGEALMADVIADRVALSGTLAA